MSNLTPEEEAAAKELMNHARSLSEKIINVIADSKEPLEIITYSLAYLAELYKLRTITDLSKLPEIKKNPAQLKRVILMEQTARFIAFNEEDAISKQMSDSSYVG